MVSGAPKHCHFEIIEPLNPRPEPFLRMNAGEPLGKALKFLMFADEIPVREAGQLLGGGSHKFTAGKGGFGDDFRRRARRGRTEIGDKIADGKINLVSHRRNNRDA